LNATAGFATAVVTLVCIECDDADHFAYRFVGDTGVEAVVVDYSADFAIFFRSVRLCRRLLID
jgi:hypothetical protein